MTLLTNRGNVRANLKIDPKKKIWSDETLTRFINEGQRWLVNDPAMNWDFGETIGYLVPVLSYQEYSKSSDDNPENFFSPNVRQILRAGYNGSFVEKSYLPNFAEGNSNSPSQIGLYAQRLFLNAGYDKAAVYTTLHNMDTINGNGAWVATNDAVNLVEDAISKEGAGSLAFDITVATTTSNKATLTNSTLSTVDLSVNDLNEGGIILWAYLTNSDNIRSFEILFGNSMNDYYSAKQYASDVQGLKYKDGWNRIFIPTINKAQVGTPLVGSIGFLQVNIQFDSTTGNQTACKIDNVQYVDKYLSYWYTLKSSNLVSDSDESMVPSDYQYIYELYATFKALSIISGKEQSSQKFFEEARFNKNMMIEELAYNTPQEFKMINR